MYENIPVVQNRNCCQTSSLSLTLWKTLSCLFQHLFWPGKYWHCSLQFQMVLNWNSWVGLTAVTFRSGVDCCHQRWHQHSSHYLWGDGVTETKNSCFCSSCGVGDNLWWRRILSGGDVVSSATRAAALWRCRYCSSIPIPASLGKTT